MTQERHAAYHSYLEAGGEMGELTRSYNWSETILGHPSTWSQSLLTTVSIILKAKFPMFLWWGNELIQFYNDAYRPSLGNEGKHPKALGQYGEECWPEIWPVIKPLIDQVISGGESHWSEDQLIPIYRNGRLEDVYWTFSYSKVNDEPGKPGGVLVVCSETTDKVIARQKIDQTLNALAISENRVRYMLADAPVAIAVLTGRDMIIESANKKVLEAWGKTDQVVGKPLHIALPELQGQPFLQILDNVYTSGQPFYGYEIKALLEQHGKIEEVYSNFVYHPLKDEQGETYSIMLVANIVTEQVIARKQLEKTQDMLKLAIDSAGIGTWSVDMLTETVSLSARAKSIHGFPEDAIITISESFLLITEDYRSAVLDQFTKAIETGQSFEAEYYMQPVDGSKKRWLRSNGKAYYDDHGKPIYFTGAIFDMTEQKEDDIRKNDFIAMVSHELKTPLTSLSGLIQLMYSISKQETDDDKTLMLEKADRQVKKMAGMINGFLDVSRLESGKIQLNISHFDLVQLIRDSIGEMALTLPDHTIAFDNDSIIMLYADKVKIESVIVNLLNNAVKYSPNEKTITITSSAADGMVKVSVADKGVGILAEDVERIFERFYRVENANNQIASGFGLGLYLSAEIIRRHSGHIWVETNPGLGSTFYFILPSAID